MQLAMVRQLITSLMVVQEGSGASEKLGLRLRMRLQHTSGMLP